eukprot:Blabericola_migrator_1__5414@NODE_2771_length_2371_cov_77_181858_g1735_i0_p1_GENE_NODE_2771_length_2371_cov_77_181858_g1735_i0NODE_2771_length_2371_cov_77_181858_g1735_i0_p1_ORF_typecomplete_len463_score91_90ABC_tran/PF00005_27/2_9e38ABC_membrane/PF00664_23/1_3e19AAA_16/PF13191_6/4_7e05SMC_N/PF02463_19/1_4e03SMC_N/PF02463_19/3_9e05AAA_21/PF13304_6/0_0003AAA_5/PF07728_14/0_27AAA_5/PF07728_14/5ABC_ATPase/PF09818_9/9_1ABC_ATPase/PF09818_9/0_068SbcCD_C/PF13558_6/0_014RsgA_GTPase/PF03193_16/0_0037Rsg
MNAIGIGIAMSWQLALVAACMLPLSFLCGYLNSRLANSTQPKETETEDHQAPSFVMNESVNNIRTIAALSLEERMCAQYDRALKMTAKSGVWDMYIAGTCVAVISACTPLINALSFWYADKLVTRKEATPVQVLRVYFMYLTANHLASKTMALLKEHEKTKVTTASIISILEQQAAIDVLDPRGVTYKITGNMKFEHIRFRYPHRPDMPVLADVSFKVDSGTVVALVGGSGIGKSTIVQLLERFYDNAPTDTIRLWLQRTEGTMRLQDLYGGQIRLDDTDIRDYNLKYLRSQLGLVSQEPILFQGTIKDNIRFGRLEASDPEIEEAAKLANAHEFICNLPDGYETDVGKGGNRLSGGQKQRVAIARALIRKPAVLILDEATSALDPESEDIVQKALDDVMQGRSFTTLVIAHRLSTIRNADQIVVFVPEPGVGSRIAEIGTHDELMQMPAGVYKTLVEANQK